MAIPNVSTPSQAVASYTAQLQATQNRPQQAQAAQNQATQNQGVKAQNGDRVTLSAQSLQGSGQTNRVQNQSNQVLGAGVTQAANKAVTNPAVLRAAESKSVTQALQAYVQTSLV